ncbi:MAG: rRNA (uridine2479-2-O)-methyltransferase [Mycobacterium sp.]|jgi:TrmH family RNA methyltransferase|nr:rRNA (uridine2479-2-O)-methyltransferase [Mycobacterium sp.]
MKVTTRNASFQQWQALLTNRTKRQRAGEFVVQGVRPINLARANGWNFRALLYPDGQSLSCWARGTLDAVSTTQYALAPALMRELGEKEEEVPELLAVVELPNDDLRRIPVSSNMLVIVFDRPSRPGNVGTLIRSADAFGASGLIITGHAADVYDPKAVRASTGSLFAVPVVRAQSHHEVLGWADGVRGSEPALQIVGTDEQGDVDIQDRDLTGPTLVIVGSEAHGLSAAWREASDRLLRIPITGAASSLNAATAGSVALYEAARQRANVRGRLR